MILFDLIIGLRPKTTNLFYLEMNEYGNPEYWCKRYESEESTFDWYIDWDEFDCYILPEIQIQCPALIVGCGNSDFSYRMECDGFFPVVSIDIAKNVVVEMKRKLRGDYLVMDACKMQFRSNIFPCVIDKGTFDAIYCLNDNGKNASSYLLEIARVLSPGGVFILITYGSPEKRLPILDLPNIFHWNLEKHIEIEKCNKTCYAYIFFKKH